MKKLTTIVVLSFLLMGCGFNDGPKLMSRFTFWHDKAAVARQPSETVVEHGAADSAEVALTFDADMTPHMIDELKNGTVKSWFDEKIIKTLHDEKVPATIFMTGMWAQQYPEEVRKFARDNSLEIENHSWDHPGFKQPCYGLAKADDKAGEIEKTQNLLQSLTGRLPIFFRFPGGCYDQSDVDMVHQSGMDVVEWDVVSGDAFSKNAKRIEKNVLDGVKNGSIVVMHLNGGPNAPETSTALPGIIKGLQDKGFRFVLLKDLLAAPRYNFWEDLKIHGRLHYFGL